MVVHPLNVTAVPQCGLACLAQGLPVSSCAPTDTACLCDDEEYLDFTTPCVISNCTVKDQLRTQRASMISCGTPVTELSGGLRALHATLFGCVTLMFILRMYTRASRMTSWGWDDTTLVLAYILSAGFFGAGLAEAALHAGKQFWAMEFWEITATILVLYITQIFYALALIMIKISICFFYLRIFPQQGFRKWIWGTQVFNVLLMTAFFLTAITQCRPLNSFWLGWDGEHEYQCFNYNAVAYAHAALNLALDIWMLILPATQIWSLHMNLKRKIAVSAMFSCGLILTVVSTVRMTTLTDFGKDTKDPHALQRSQMNYYQTGVWSCVEVYVAVMVACLPAARLVIIKYTTCLMDTVRGTQDRSKLPSYANQSSVKSCRRSNLGSKIARGRGWTNSIPAATTDGVISRVEGDLLHPIKLNSFEIEGGMFSPEVGKEDEMNKEAPVELVNFSHKI